MAWEELLLLSTLCKHVKYIEIPRFGIPSYAVSHVATRGPEGWQPYSLMGANCQHFAEELGLQTSDADVPASSRSVVFESLGTFSQGTSTLQTYIKVSPITF